VLFLVQGKSRTRVDFSLSNAVRKSVAVQRCYDHVEVRASFGNCLKIAEFLITYLRLSKRHIRRSLWRYMTLAAGALTMAATSRGLS